MPTAAPRSTGGRAKVSMIWAITAADSAAWSAAPPGVGAINWATVDRATSRAVHEVRATFMGRSPCSGQLRARDRVHDVVGDELGAGLRLAVLLDPLGLIGVREDDDAQIERRHEANVGGETVEAAVLGDEGRHPAVGRIARPGEAGQEDAWTLPGGLADVALLRHLKGRSQPRIDLGAVDLGLAEGGLRERHHVAGARLERARGSPDRDRVDVGIAGRD